MIELKFPYTGSDADKKAVRKRNDLCRKHIGIYAMGWYYKKDLKKGIITYYIKKNHPTSVLLALT